MEVTPQGLCVVFGYHKVSIDNYTVAKLPLFSCLPLYEKYLCILKNQSCIGKLMKTGAILVKLSLHELLDVVVTSLQMTYENKCIACKIIHFKN